MNSIIFSIFFFVGVYCSDPCGDPSWTKYKDEKCFKILPSTISATRDGAEELCNGQVTGNSDDNVPTLVEILSADEQQLLEQYLFGSSQLVENVWTRAQRKDDNKFYWNEVTEVKYSNWEPDAPSDSSVRGCMVLQSGLTRSIDEAKEDSENNPIETQTEIIAGGGLWKDVSCLSRQLVVCQKFQTWSVPKIQTTLMKIRSNLEFEIANKIPIGFIYVELPDRAPPQSLWPAYIWQDVSANYAGLFFRVLGGNSNEFGTNQDSNSPRLVAVSAVGGQAPNDINVNPDANPSSPVNVGGNAGDLLGLTFKVSSDEVRPQNTAVRVWLRVG